MCSLDFALDRRRRPSWPASRRAALRQVRVCDDLVRNPSFRHGARTRGEGGSPPPEGPRPHVICSLQSARVCRVLGEGLLPERLRCFDPASRFAPGVTCAPECRLEPGRLRGNRDLQRGKFEHDLPLRAGGGVKRGPRARDRLMEAPRGMPSTPHPACNGGLNRKNSQAATLLREGELVCGLGSGARRLEVLRCLLASLAQ